jgi:hypothetical protein
MITANGNEYDYVKIEGEVCVRFKTKGKHTAYVIVDKELWDVYLSGYSWIGGKSLSGRIDAKTTVEGGAQWCLYKLIVDKQFDELDSWNRTIDHKNHDPLDNRKSNLIPCPPILNSANLSSKYTSTDEMYIRKQSFGGYKFECYIAKERCYRQFSPKTYGSDELAYKAAKEYRDHWLKFERPALIVKAEKKCRIIEFERGLRDMLRNDEQTDIASILAKYGINEEFLRQYLEIPPDKPL